ncbi:MAG: hypothetical protein E6H90_14285 [Chloroflexi bacterium]|nr:MAG: hypothetical protein E6H90_14285 [Chloroflexota bacterium]
MNRDRALAGALLAVVGALTLSAAEPATAQQPGTRHGFWGAFGLGYGANGLSCSGGCSFNSGAKGGGLTVALKLGGTPSPRVRLGGEVNLWTKDMNGVTETVGNISAAAYLYPTARSGFFVKGGVGVASFQLSQGSSTTSADGLGFLTGLGYDIRLSNKVSLSPIANFYFGHDGDLKDGSTVVIPGIKHAIFDVGLSVQYN